MLDSTLAEINRLKNENKDLKKLVQICDEGEHEYKEEIVNLKTQLEEARRIVLKLEKSILVGFRV